MSKRIEDRVSDGKWHSHFFTDDPGGHVGSLEMNVNGSVTPQSFYIAPEEDEYYVVYRMVGELADAGSFSADGFGNGNSLTNGMKLTKENAGGIIDEVTHANLPVKTNINFAAYCYDVTYHDFGVGLGDKSIVWRWTFAKDGLPLVLAPGEFLRWTVQDDLSGISGLTIRAGIVEVKAQYWN